MLGLVLFYFIGFLLCVVFQNEKLAKENRDKTMNLRLKVDTEGKVGGNGTGSKVAPLQEQVTDLTGS